jgi:PAS domain S-box-containing protein
MKQTAAELNQLNERLRQEIAERRRAEAALQESQRSLSTLLSNLPGMAYRCRNDRDWTMEFVSYGCFEVTGYTRADLIGNRKIAYGQLIHPADRAGVWDEVQLALAEKKPFQITYRLTTPTGEEKWVWEQGRGVFSSEGDLLAIEGFITDITERTLANRELEVRIRTRTRELTTLFEVQQAIICRLDPDAVMQLIAAEARRLTVSQRAIVFLLEADEFRIAADSAEEAGETFLGYRIPATGSLAESAIQTQKPVYVADAQNDPHVKADPRRQALVDQAGVKTLMIVPLISGGEPFGAICMANKSTGKFGPNDERVLTVLASSAVIGLENARLYQKEHERKQQLQTLLEVTATASHSLDLDEMLRTTLDRLVSLVGASRAGVVLLNEDSGAVELRTLRPERKVAPENLAELIEACQQVIASGEPLYIPPDAELAHLEPGALLPLCVRGQALGVLGIIGPEGGGFSHGQLALFESIADQISVAVDNARLYAQAQQFAVVEERQRLARELHDAVTQTLFTASLIAEVLPETWELDPIEGQQLLQELRQLSRGALAEMRTLLLELRPAILAQTSLGDLLRQLGEVVTGRTGIPVTITEKSQGRLPAEVHLAFYRIAQEALNNVAKHARASQATLRLDCSPISSGTVERQKEAIALRISDDGCGFDLSAVSPDHMGLGIMRERAEEIGATLAINSNSGAGTEVSVRWENGGRNTKEE